MFNKYEDGKTITRVFMGFNSGEVTRSIYGNRNYWMSYRNKIYDELLTVVQELLQEYKVNNKI